MAKPTIPGARLESDSRRYVSPQHIRFRQMGPARPRRSRSVRRQQNAARRPNRARRPPEAALSGRPDPGHWLFLVIVVASLAVGVAVWVFVLRHIWAHGQ
jgi:hypothetical protein